MNVLKSPEKEDWREAEAPVCHFSAARETLCRFVPALFRNEKAVIQAGCCTFVLHNSSQPKNVAIQAQINQRFLKFFLTPLRTQTLGFV